jgi:hypothetical protein
MASLKEDKGLRTVIRHNGNGDNSEIKMKRTRQETRNASNYAKRNEELCKILERESVRRS